MDDNNKSVKFFILQVHGTEINLVFSMVLHYAINNGSWMRLRYFNERLSTFTGNWPWAWKSKTASSKTMHSKDARCVYVRVRAPFYAPSWCVQVWRERTVDLFCFALFIIVFSSLDSWQRQSEMSRKGRVINHGMEVGFWARLFHSIGFLPLLSSALNEREGTRGNSGWSVNTLSCFYWSQSTQTENNTKNKKHKPLTDLYGPVYTWY